MDTEIKIEITNLPVETAQVIILAASNWNCTPDEAAKRLLNEEASRRLKAQAA